SVAKADQRHHPEVASPHLTFQIIHPANSLLRFWGRHYGLFGPLVDGELEDVGTRVVPGDVEVVLAARDLAEVQLGTEDRLLFENRSHQHFAGRIDDAAAAPHQERMR